MVLVKTIWLPVQGFHSLIGMNSYFPDESKIGLDGRKNALVDVRLLLRHYPDKAEPLLYAIRTLRFDLECNLAEHRHKWQRTRNFPGADLNPDGHSPGGNSPI